jgi:hypothetical protein
MRWIANALRLASPTAALTVPFALINPVGRLRLLCMSRKRRVAYQLSDQGDRHPASGADRGGDRRTRRAVGACDCPRPRMSVSC